jgi:hypothetical protein
MAKNQPRLPHFCYYQALAASPDESSIEWYSAKAGLIVLRKIDQWVEIGPEAITSPDAMVEAHRQAVAELGDVHPFRGPLMAILDALCENPERSRCDLTPHLMAYAQGLEDGGQWELAVDVYDTVVQCCMGPPYDISTVLAAEMRQGDCLRVLEQWKDAASSYHRAEALATKSGDTEIARAAHVARKHLPSRRKKRR